jgi:hypothetical protein
MKNPIKQLLGLLIVLLLVVFAFRANAQTLSVGGSVSNITASGAVVYGGITCTNLLGGSANSVTLRLFYGGNDGADVATAWANSVAISSAKTNTVIIKGGVIISIQ